MEGLGSNSVTCDYKIRFAQIAALGNKPQDWKEYIDIVKSRAQLFDEFRKNRIVAYMYFNAFKGIPESDKSLDHAQLLIDYAEFKSHQDQKEAVRLMAYGRRILSHFSIIHVVSAELELKAGNKEKAFSILKKASSLGAKPVAMTNLALHRLSEGKTNRLMDNLCEYNTDMVSPRSDNDSWADNSQLSGTFCEPKQTLPGCKSSTQEVQCDLDILTSVPEPASSYFDQKQIQRLQHQQHLDFTPHGSDRQALNSIQSPQAPVLLLKKYSDLAKDKSDHNSVRQTFGPVNFHDYVPETPHGQRLLATKDDCGGTTKRTLLNFYNTPDMRQPYGSAVKGSISKFRPLNLGPPQRVKVNPAMRKLRDEEEEELHTQDITVSMSDLFHSQPGPAGETQSEDISPISEEMRSGTLKDISNTKCSNESDLHSAPTSSNIFPLMSLSSTSTRANRITPASLFPSVHNQHECPGTFDQNDMIDNKMDEDGYKSKESSLQKIQSAVNLEHPRKLLPFSADMIAAHDINSMPRPTSQIMNAASSSYYDVSTNVKGLDEMMRSESTKEILARQQECIQRQHELVQQLLQQQHLLQQQQAGTTNRTFSIPTKQSAIASTITPTKPHSVPGQKTIFVNKKPYTVIGLVGRGGSAKVYRVNAPESNSVRALKCVNLICANKVIVDGYKNEIILLEKLQHCDRVVRLYDSEYIEDSKKLLVVLEFGETDLCKFISQNENRKAMHSATIRYFWLQMVLAVSAMHKEGVIHSDLKPANFIMVSGEVKLIDFGIANSLQQDNTSILKDNVIGTPSYMSPEALRAINVTPSPADTKPKYKVGVRSDVWSLGCILYQMVYGHTPFQHVRQKLEAIVDPSHEIPFPDQRDPVLMDVLKKCLTRDIQLRPTTEELLCHPYLA